jgi:hypothetical protein
MLWHRGWVKFRRFFSATIAEPDPFGGGGKAARLGRDLRCCHLRCTRNRRRDFLTRARHPHDQAAVEAASTTIPLASAVMLIVTLRLDLPKRTSRSGTFSSALVCQAEIIE